MHAFGQRIRAYLYAYNYHTHSVAMKEQAKCFPDELFKVHIYLIRIVELCALEIFQHWSR